jgi:hypothetical protein
MECIVFTAEKKQNVVFCTVTQSSGQNMEAADSSEILVTTYETTASYNSENHKIESPFFLDTMLRQWEHTAH